VNGLLESAHLTRDLHLLLQAGMPVHEALARVQARSSGRWAVALGKARDEAAAGAPLATALRMAESFPLLLVEGLEAAEDELPLMRLSQLLERAHWRQRQTQVVLAYPLLLLLAGLALFLLLGLTVGRSIPEIYSQMNLNLALLTRISLNVVGLATNAAVIALVLAVTAALGWILAGNSQASAAQRLRLPLVGSWLRRSEACNWLEWADYYLNNHRPAPEALCRAARACQDPAFRAQAEAAAAAAERGQELGQAIHRQGLLPDLALWLISQAETQEFPAHSLAGIASILNRELETEAEGGLACLEVLAVFLIAAVLVPMVFSFFMPLYQLLGDIGG
jgi:type II secretory pathway component PulF